jgi:K+-transporting ATPase KdpF subunit
MARGAHETASVLYNDQPMSPTLVIATVVAVLLAVYLIVAMLAPERFG